MTDVEKVSESTDNANVGIALASEAYITPTLPIADLEHPWLGLESFQEETRAYFFGRDAEIDELHLRLRNLPLLILYGRSGLGKTSILKAGLIPRLREENQLPLLLRLRYGDTTSDPCSQLVSAVFNGKMGKQIEPVSLAQAIEWMRCLGEKLKFSFPEDIHSLLWLRLHYRDEPPAISHLIIDQFEEVFTLGAQDPGVENCVRDILALLLQRVIPQPISRLILEHNNFLDHFDPDSIPVRVLLALRDDYVYALNRWRRHLPALSQNNFELRALRGSAAFDAVYRPGTLRCHYQGKVSEEDKIETGLLPIISEETAEKIVRFFAKKNDDIPLEEIEADSPILSLLCRQLNDHRFNQSPCAAQIQFDGKADIDKIIAEFYDRCLAQRPEAVRTFIEEELVSRSGARLAQDEKSILDAFEDAYKDRNDNWFVQEGYGNATATDARACLNDLVSRRLLSPLAGDKPRYELTHDLLVKVVEEKRTEARERRQWIKKIQDSQQGEISKIRDNIIKMNWIALVAFFIILLLWKNAEDRFNQWRDKPNERVNAVENCISQRNTEINECKKKYKPEEHDKALRECNQLKNKEFQICTEFSERKINKAKDDAKALINLLGIKVEVLYPAAILSLLVLGLLVYLRRARSNVLRSSTAIVKASRQLGESLEGVLPKTLGKIWWLAPLPNKDGKEVTARDLERALQWQDHSRRNTILAAITSVLLIFVVCYFLYLGLITKEFILSREFMNSANGFWISAVWQAMLILCVFWTFFQIYAWWRQRRVPEFEDGQIRDGLSRREFLIALPISCVLVVFFTSKLTELKVIRSQGNPRYRMPKPQRWVPEPTLPVGAFRKNVNSGIFHGILPSKPAKRLAREIIPVVHCLPLKPEALEPIEDIAVLRSITLTAADGKDGKKEPHVQLSRSACAFEQAALARIVSNDIEGACQLLLAGVRHDLFYSSRMRRRSSVHLYDLLAGLAVRHDMPQHLKSLDGLIKEQKDQMNAIHKRQKIWEDTTSNWYKRWTNKSKPFKWSGVPM